MAHSATLRDIADHAGCSVSTVSRALADNPRIAKETRSEIRRIAADLGYRPNIQARSLRSSRSMTIGITVPSLVNPYFADMATIIQRTAAVAGYSTLIANTNEDAAELRMALDVMSGQRVAGCIVVPHEGAEEQIAELEVRDVPVVLVDRSVPGFDFYSVESDPYPGIHDAVHLLVQRGHRRIGYLSGPGTTSTGRDRLRVFQDVCLTLGVDGSNVFPGGYEQDIGREGAYTLLDQGIDTLVAGDSMMTAGVIEACHRRGLFIGDDVALVGFDTHPVLALQPRPLTVIDQDVGGMANRAFEILLRRIEGAPPRSRQHRIPTTLEIRESTPYREVEMSKGGRQ